MCISQCQHARPVSGLDHGTLTGGWVNAWTHVVVSVNTGAGEALAKGEFLNWGEGVSGNWDKFVTRKNGYVNFDVASVVLGVDIECEEAVTTNIKRQNIGMRQHFLSKGLPGIASIV